MMETKRDKEWRKKQCFRVFKKRMILIASEGGGYGNKFVLDDGQLVYNPHWFELAKCSWTHVYKTTGTPCSCMICKGERYNRTANKKEIRGIINESLDEL